MLASPGSPRLASLASRVSLLLLLSAAQGLSPSCTPMLHQGPRLTLRPPHMHAAGNAGFLRSIPLAASTLAARPRQVALAAAAVVAVTAVVAQGKKGRRGRGLSILLQLRLRLARLRAGKPRKEEPVPGLVPPAAATTDAKAESRAAAMAASLAAADPVRAVGLAGPAEAPPEASATAEQLAALLAAMAAQDEPPPPAVEDGLTGVLSEQEREEVIGGLFDQGYGSLEDEEP